MLSFFGLSLAVVKIAGGLLVISSGWRMTSVEATTEPAPPTTEPAWRAMQVATRAFYPLTFPLTVGPGSLSVAVTLGAGARTEHVGPLAATVGALTGIAIVAGTIFLTYRYAPGVIRKLGITGTVILLRLSAFILLAVGVQILCDGVVERFR